jgi:hypothetical protein
MMRWLRKGIESTASGSGGNFECGVYGALTLELDLGSPSRHALQHSPELEWVS